MSTSNVAVWCLAGDQEDLVVAWVDVDTQNKRLQSLHLELLRPDLVAASEEASVAVEVSVVASVVIEVDMVTEADMGGGVALATKEAVVSVADKEAIKVDLRRQMHLADREVEVGMAEVTTTDATVMEAIEEVVQEAIKILLEGETGAMTATATEIETEIVIVTDMPEADAKTTMARESGITKTMGTTTPDKDGGIEHNSHMRVQRLLQHSHHGWLVGILCCLYSNHIFGSTPLLPTPW